MEVKDAAATLIKSPWWLVVGAGFALGGYVASANSLASRLSALDARLAIAESVLDQRTDILTVVQVNQRDVLRSLCEIKRHSGILPRTSDCEANLPAVIMPRTREQERLRNGQRP